MIESKIFNPKAKVLVHYKKIREYFKTGNVDPITLEIDPSNACNHSCPFCISGHIHLDKFKGTKFFDRRIMKKEVLMNLVKDISKMDIQSLSWTGGGEPTQNPHLKEAMEYINKNSKIQMGMFTNGTLLERFDLFNIVGDVLFTIKAIASGIIPGLSRHLASKRSSSSKLSLVKMAPIWII